MSNNTSSEHPPTSPNHNDLWYNTATNIFYIFDNNINIWNAVLNENIIEINLTDNLEEKEDPVKAYNRAMGII